MMLRSAAGPPPCLALGALVLPVLLAQAQGNAVDESCPAGSGPGCGPEFTRARTHHWPRARGSGTHYGVTNLTGPPDLSKPRYSFFPGSTRFRSVCLCGPLIDDNMNLYVTFVDGIHKLTWEGTRIWKFAASGGISDCPSLMNGVLYGTDTTGSVFAVNIELGTRIWQRQYSFGSGDTGYVENHDGVVIYEGDENRRVVAVRGSNGGFLWDFRPDAPVWNLMAMFPGDGTVLFQDHDSRTYRLGLHNGTLLWKGGGGHVQGVTWTDGGAILGPNGLIYAVSAKSGVINHHPTSGGGIHAYRIADGTVVWQKHLLRPCFTWPVVGRLKRQKRDSVIVAIGSNAYFPWKQVFLSAIPGIVSWSVMVGLAAAFAMRFIKRKTLKRLSLGLVGDFLLAFVATLLLVPLGTSCWYAYGRMGLPIQTFYAEIYAFDAETGAQQWVYELPPWPYVSAAGDSEGFFERRIYFPQRSSCLPAAYNAPTIDGDGAVWIGYHDGMLLKLQDNNGDGFVTENEVQRFDTKAAFLHSGTAFAPGIMAVTNCDSMYLWTY